MDQKLTHTRDTVRKGQWKIARFKLALKREEEMDELLDEKLDVGRKFFDAVELFIEGNSSVLVEYLMESDSPLSNGERRYLGFALSGAVRRRRGRRADLWTHSAAQSALFFYKLWRAENKRCDVDDRGLSNDMKDDAARIVVEDMKLPSKKLAAVRELMDRPAWRRSARRSTAKNVD